MTFLVFASLILAAPAPKDKPATPEPYGLWELERSEGGSGKAKARKGPLRYQYNRDGTWVVFEGEKEVAGPRPFKFDAKAKPATLDTFSNGTFSNKGDQNPDVLAIYKIDGDTLTLCKAYPGEKRPTEFKVTEGTSDYLMIFRRVKDK